MYYIKSFFLKNFFQKKSKKQKEEKCNEYIKYLDRRSFQEHENFKKKLKIRKIINSLQYKQNKIETKLNEVKTYISNIKNAKDIAQKQRVIKDFLEYSERISIKKLEKIKYKNIKKIITNKKYFDPYRQKLIEEKEAFKNAKNILFRLIAEDKKLEEKKLMKKIKKYFLKKDLTLNQKLKKIKKIKNFYENNKELRDII